MLSGLVQRNGCDHGFSVAQATQVCMAEQQWNVGLSVAADLDVLSVVGMHELDATNSLLLALVRVGHKGAGLQCTTVDPHKSQCALHAQYNFSPHGVSSAGEPLKASDSKWQQENASYTHGHGEAARQH